MACSSDKTFNSGFCDLGPFYSDFTQDQIKREPMFFNSDLDNAWLCGGPITRSFINALPDDWEAGACVLDSRVHMLMPGWYPAIPGFHHDDVPRASVPVGKHFMTAGQPDYDNPRYRSEHIMGLVNGEVAPTVFASGTCTMPAVPDGELIYRKWHSEIERLLTEGKMSKTECPSGRLIYFDCYAFHTAQKAVANGWRWFCRVTRKSDRCHQITNEIRSQVQVYLEFPMDGW